MWNETVAATNPTTLSAAKLPGRHTDLRNEIAPDADCSLNRCPIINKHLEEGPQDGESCRISTDIMWGAVPTASSGHLDEVGALWAAEVVFQIDISPRTHSSIGIEGKNHTKVNRWFLCFLLRKSYKEVDKAKAIDAGVWRQADSNTGWQFVIGHEFDHCGTGGVARTMIGFVCGSHSNLLVG